MSALLIDYDLNKPGQNYEKLYETIRALGPWWHFLDSTWIVSASLTASQVFERLRPVLDESDRILVLDITRDNCSGWLAQDAWDWIRKYV